MCLILGVQNQAPHIGAFVATETRVTYVRPHDGKPRDYRDVGSKELGSKIIWTGTGWAVGTGNGHQIVSLMDALRAAGPIPPANLPARAKQLAEGAWASYENVDSQNVLLLIEPNCGVVFIRPGSATIEELVAASPPKELADGKMLHRSLVQNVQAAQQQIFFQIQAAARYFHVVASRWDGMSDMMEIGCLFSFAEGSMRLFLRGNARDIGKSDPREIGNLFQAEPPTQHYFEVARARSAARRLARTATREVSV